MQPHGQPQYYQPQPQPGQLLQSQVPVQQHVAQPGAVIVQRQNSGGGGVIVIIGIIVVVLIALSVIAAGVMYVWANSLAADQPESGTRNSYAADDAYESTSWNSDDELISVRWQHAEDDLNWAFVVMKLSIGDNTYDCATDASQECRISQDGWDDSVWETGEFLILSESDTNICSSTCSIYIYVTYRGTAVAGNEQVTVS